MKKAIRFLPLVLLLALPPLWVLNCSGPRPTVSNVEVTPPTSAGAPYVVTALVSNEGFGRGESAVTIRLRDQQTGQVYQQILDVTLKTDEQVRVRAEFQAPPGDYVADVRAEYPNR